MIIQYLSSPEADAHTCQQRMNVLFALCPCLFLSWKKSKGNHKGFFSICAFWILEIPVSHDCHSLRCPPKSLDNSWVTDDHDYAGEKEGDHQLVDGEVDTENDDDGNDIDTEDNYPMLSSVSLQ